MNPMHVFVEIGKGFKWVGHEVGQVFVELPRLLRLTHDVEEAATTVLPETIAVVQDAGALVRATVKDSGVFLGALAGLSAAVTKAMAGKAMNVAADMAVIAAFQEFCHAFDRTNVADILAAWQKLAEDTKTLDASVLATLKKLEEDMAG